MTGAWSLEVKGILALLQSWAVPHRVTDIDGPGHATGSFHYGAGTGGDGLAVDVAGRIPYALHPAQARADMLAICARLKPYEPNLAELICSHLTYSVKNGKRVARIAVAAHWDHIHIAVHKGTVLHRQPRPVEVIIVPDPNNPDLPDIQGPLQLAVLQDQDGMCTGYAIMSTVTGELHGWGPGWKYYGRSEDPTPTRHFEG